MLIALGVALAVGVPVLAAGPMDALIVFALTFGVVWGALILVTNP